MPIAFAASRPLRPGEMDNEAVRQQLHSRPPAFVFGSINEKIYLSEAGAQYTNFIPAAFPGPIVRRSVGTPFMGYRGTVHILQEIVNRLYEVLFNFLPVDTAYAQKQRASNGTVASNRLHNTTNRATFPGGQRPKLFLMPPWKKCPSWRAYPPAVKSRCRRNGRRRKPS
jgi:hypothetical protein